VKSFNNHDEWTRFSQSDEYLKSQIFLRRINFRFWLTPKQNLKIKGFCDVCGFGTQFMIDDKHSIANDLGGGSSKFLKKKVNFRERLECSRCNLNQRMRSAVSLVNLTINKSKPTQVWIQEAITPLCKVFSSQYQGLVGTEYFGSKFISGQFVDGIRHEDATSSSFETSSLDGVLSFDVLEHVPNFQDAFNESFRVLKSGGVFCWSAPFNLLNSFNEVRARVEDDGKITHLLPPEYHGDPVNPKKGILCFQTFGWEILDQLRLAGFRDVKLFWHNDSTRGILSLENVFIVGYK
jgi:SAM-dependent methyltransferase